MGVIVSGDDLPAIREQATRAGKRIAFASGSFDLLHQGHLHTLETARASADVLVAGVYDDGTTRMLKGPGRPLQPEGQRVSLVSCLDCVDYAVLISDLTVDTILTDLRPDVFVIGNDSIDSPQALHESDLVKRDGGSVLVLPLIDDLSVERLVNSIRNGFDVPRNREAIERSGSWNGHDTDGEPEVTFSFANFGKDWSIPSTSQVFTMHGLENEDLIFGSIKKYRTFFETDVLRFLTSVVEPGGVILDVGANIGNHSVYFATYLAELVIALEPAPELASLLRRNVEANGLDNVIVFEKAAGHRAGTGAVVRPEQELHNAGATQIRPIRQKVVSPERDQVQITTIDAIWAECAPLIGDRPASLLKIDVEGSEYAVLKGARGLILTEKPDVVVELTSDSTYYRVSKFLHEYGYRATMRFGNIVPSYFFTCR